MTKLTDLISIRNYLYTTLETTPKEFSKTNQQLIKKIDLLINKKLSKDFLKVVDKELSLIEKKELNEGN